MAEGSTLRTLMAAFHVSKNCFIFEADERPAGSAIQDNLSMKARYGRAGDGGSVLLLAKGGGGGEGGGRQDGEGEGESEWGKRKGRWGSRRKEERKKEKKMGKRRGREWGGEYGVGEGWEMRRVE